MRANSLAVGLAVVFGIAIGITISKQSTEISPAAHAQEPAKPVIDLATLQADIEHLKKTAPDQAHVMQDVDYHFTNLWYAAQLNNWPLAQFYLNETKSHLRWAVRVIPVRKDNAGKEIKLEDILQAMENSPLKQLEEAVAAKNPDKFVAAYELSLTTCYSCHKANDKPFLRLRIPVFPATTTINLDPEKYFIRRKGFI